MRRGELIASDPHRAATQFLAIIVGDLQLPALLGVGVPSVRARNATAIAGADAFMRAYTPGPS